MTTYLGTPVRTENETVLKTDNMNVYYGDFLAVRDVSIAIPKNSITAFIGPSGCGKSTVLRCFNRLNDLIKGFRLRGQVYYHDQNLYDSEVDPVEVRRRIGMVFQKPNPFPKSIYDNVAFGPRLVGYKGNMDELVENALRGAALWDEVKDKLRESGTALSGGQQQRLCIARTIALQSDVILMDEPCSALDPISTLKVEDLLQELKERYTIIIVTHNMQQASRSSDYTAFFNVEATPRGRTGHVVEYDRTEVIFQNPQQQATQAYVSGRFG
jgi:phosphate transport system ATP-binding protein